MSAGVGYAVAGGNGLPPAPSSGSTRIAHLSFIAIHVCHLGWRQRIIYCFPPTHESCEANMGAPSLLEDIEERRTSGLVDRPARPMRLGAENFPIFRGTAARPDPYITPPEARMGSEEKRLLSSLLNSAEHYLDLAQVVHSDHAVEHSTEAQQRQLKLRISIRRYVIFIIRRTIENRDEALQSCSIKAVDKLVRGSVPLQKLFCQEFKKLDRQLG